MVSTLSFCRRIQAIRLLFPREIAREERPNAGSHPPKGAVRKQFIVVEKFRQKVMKFIEQRESVDVLVGHGAERDKPDPHFQFLTSKIEGV